MGKKLFFILFHHKHYFSALNCKLKIVAKKGKWLPNQILAKPSLELECRALTGAAPFSSLLCLIKYIYLSRYLDICNTLLILISILSSSILISSLRHGFVFL